MIQLDSCTPSSDSDSQYHFEMSFVKVPPDRFVFFAAIAVPVLGSKFLLDKVATVANSCRRMMSKKIFSTRSLAVDAEF